jgi:hypothetical protein
MRDDDEYSKFLGIGSAWTTETKPNAEEREEIKKRRPIGFVHFKEDECLTVPNAAGRRRSKKRAANSGSANAKRAGTGSARSKKNARKSSR